MRDLPQLRRRSLAASTELFQRVFTIRAAKVIDAEKRILEFTASSEYPVDRGDGEIEVLSHEPSAVRLERLRAVGSLHLDHVQKATSAVAGIIAAEVTAKQLVIRCAFGSKQLAQDAYKDVIEGVVRGISAGYVIHDVRPIGERFVVTDWEPWEVSLTTIPEDPTVGATRSSDAQRLRWRSLAHPNHIPAANADQPQGPIMKELIAKLTAKHGKAFADMIRSLAEKSFAEADIEIAIRAKKELASDEAEDETEAEVKLAKRSRRVAKVDEVDETELEDAEAKQLDERARSKAIKQERQRSREIVEAATSLGMLDQIDEFLLSTRSADECRVDMLAAFAKKKEGKQGGVVAPKVDVMRAAEDKIVHAVVDGMLMFGQRDHAKRENLGLRNKRFSQLVVRFAQAFGHTDAADWSSEDIAAFGLGKLPMHMRAANVTSSYFATYVLANYMDKVILNAFDNYVPTWTLWCGQRWVQDFKSFDAGDVNLASLQEKAENIPYPELASDEGGYIAKLGLFGGSVSLTMQAMTNDDLGVFDRKLSQLGALGARTIDRQAYATLMGFDYTGNSSVTAGSALGTAGKLDGVRDAFMSKKGPAGEILGNTPRYLIVPSAMRETGLQATQVAKAPATFQANTDLNLVVSPYLNDTTLDAVNASPTSYYLAADQAVADTVVVARLNGWTAPRAFEKDSGMVASRNFLLLYPLRTLVASKFGLQKGTP